MILLLIGLAFLFISTYFIYKTAKENGYNAILWTLAGVSTFISIYLVLSVTIVIIVAIGVVKLSWSINTLQNLGLLVDFFVLGASASSVMLILRHVNKIKDEDPFIENPPSPPTNFE